MTTAVRSVLVDETVLRDGDGGWRPGAIDALVYARSRSLTVGLIRDGGRTTGELTALVDVAVEAPVTASTIDDLLVRLDAPGDDTILVAGTASAIEAGRAAGLRTIGVGTAGTVGAAGLVVPTPAHLHWLTTADWQEATVVRDDDGLSLLGGWALREDGVSSATVVTQGSNRMVGNGYLGYRGTLAEWGPDAYVACVVSDTWDNADGTWAELTTVPNALFARWRHGDLDLAVAPDGTGAHRRLRLEYDIRHALSRRATTFAVPQGPEIRLDEERFASASRLHVVAQRHLLRADRPATLDLTTAIDGDVWSMNGEHLPHLDLEVDDGVLVASGTTGESGVRVVVAQALAVAHDGVGTPRDEVPEIEGRRILRRLQIDVDEHACTTVDTFMAVVTSNDADDPRTVAVEAARTAAADGWAELLLEHATAWSRTWDRHDAVIEGDDLAQVATRYGVLHNVIATPRHTDHLPIGARGLSCQAYQGAAFWDQEVFNLPMFLWGDPAVARRILTYRHRTLDGARRKASALGFDGAFYAWVSGQTGDELCPSFFFVDVLTGRPIRNHFNDWQIHVSPDIALAVGEYVTTTGDVEFLDERGAEIILEVARFCASRVSVRPDTGRAHVLRVLGPDEYHENVDDNAFTNHVVHAALELALRVRRDLADRAPSRLAELDEQLAIHDEEPARWADVRDRLVLPSPDPDTGVLEQFTGFHDLEDATPDQLRDRLQHPDEYWGWPNGVAVHTQVAKQADVVQLAVQRPELFDERTLEANVDHYLPRCQHGSSLSKSTYAIACAMLGRVDQARDLFVESSSIDLLATTSTTSGGTFIGGIRTAAAGVAWRVLVQGFLGLQVEDELVRLRPRLPSTWDALRLTVEVRRRRLIIDVERGEEGLVVEVSSPPGPGGPLPVVLDGNEVVLDDDGRLRSTVTERG